MGMPGPCSRSSASCEPPRDKTDFSVGAVGNPNPLRFRIGSTIDCGRALLAEVFYDGCTNMEGRKLLLMQFATITECKAFMQSHPRELDPHFCEHRIELIARFRPDQRGLELAKESLKIAGRE